MSTVWVILQFVRDWRIQKSFLRQQCRDWEELPSATRRKFVSFPCWIYLTDLKVSWHVNMLDKHVTTLGSFAPKQIRDKFHHAWVKVRSEASGKVFYFHAKWKLKQSSENWILAWRMNSLSLKLEMLCIHTSGEVRERGFRKLRNSWTCTSWIISSSSVRSQVLNAPLPNFPCGKTLSCTFLHE